MGLPIRRGRSERGASPVKVILSLAVIGAVYWAYAFGPHYLEFSRVKRLTRASAAYWLNIDPDLNGVKKKLTKDLEQAMVESITVEDIEYERPDHNHVEVYFYYEIEVRHPGDIVKPTLLEFEFDYIEEKGQPNY